MVNIFFKGQKVWESLHLPSINQAHDLFSQYAKSGLGRHEGDLSAGIDVELPEGYFTVQITVDRPVEPFYNPWRRQNARR